jgi:hypothetical protein
VTHHVEPWCTCGAGEFQPPEMHRPPCVGAVVDAPAEEVAGEEERFTVGEKIGSLLDLVLNTPRGSDDARTRAALSALKFARRSGLLDRFVVLFPPLEDEDAWHEWITAAVGVALNLTSDGYAVDVEAARELGAQVLGALYA